MDRGIHVHARLLSESSKELDFTYRAVILVGERFPQDGVVVSEIDAIYYMVSTVFGFSMIFVACTHCGWPHLDKDWFSVHPHRRHLCAGCGKHFRDCVTGIGNPIIGVRDRYGVINHRIVPATKTLDIKQSDFPGGIQIWGSNPALLWTSEKCEEEGIHVHAFLEQGQEEAAVDDTFSAVTIDGIKLDPVMVRVLMAQNVLPSLKGRVTSLDCPHCGQPGVDQGEAAYVPRQNHACSECGRSFDSIGRIRNLVLNPLPAIFRDLAKLAPRPPQQHRLDLLSETL
jgi:transposase-like protein